MAQQRERQDFVREIEVLESIVDAVRRDARIARGKHMQFKTALEEYQEQPQLLDPHLEGLVEPLAARLSDSASHTDDADRFAATMQTCRLLQALVNTRGHKTIVRFFPNKPPDLGKAVALLHHMHTMTMSYEVDEDAQDGSWQTRCMVLLWLSNLVLIPFDIGTVQVVASAMGAADEDAKQPAVAWMIDTARQYLSDSGPTRCISSCLTDLRTAFPVLNAATPHSSAPECILLRMSIMQGHGS